MIIKKTCECGLELRIKWNSPTISFKCQLDNKCHGNITHISFQCPHCEASVSITPEDTTPT